SNINLNDARATSDRTARSAGTLFCGQKREEYPMRLRIAAVAIAALGGVALTSTAASAMPNGIPKENEIAGQTSNIQQARWVVNSRGHRVWRRGPRVAFVRRPGFAVRPGFGVAAGPRFGVAVGTSPFWGPGWGNSYAWSPGPTWGAGPAWGP